MNNPWLYNHWPLEEVPEGAFGFVYEIRNLQNDRIYIGKKFFTKAGYKQVKGKRKKLRLESNWKDYYGSSEELSEDVEKLGKHNFIRTILKICANKSECSYWEAHYQFEKKVLLTDQSYNRWISVKVRQSPQLRP